MRLKFTKFLRLTIITSTFVVLGGTLYLIYYFFTNNVTRLAIEVSFDVIDTEEVPLLDTLNSIINNTDVIPVDPVVEEENNFTVYLIQYKNPNFFKRECFANRPSRELLVLTYRVNASDQVNTFYYPHSTLTQGRNYLINEFLTRYPDINNRPNVCIVDGDADYDCSVIDKMHDYLTSIRDQVYTAAPTYGKGTWKVKNGRTFWVNGIYQCYPPRATELFMPIVEDCDKYSWWMSQLGVINEMHLLLGSCPSNVVPHTVVKNPESEGYPRGMYNWCANNATFSKWGLKPELMGDCLSVWDKKNKRNSDRFCFDNKWIAAYEKRCLLQNNPQYFYDRERYDNLVQFLEGERDTIH